MYMIETKNLTKIYGNFAAVQRLNLHVRKGTIYGFLGPNGAGKSTTMKMFLGLARPPQEPLRLPAWSIRKTGWKFLEGPDHSSRNQRSTGI